MPRVNVRCRYCHARRVFTKHPLEYTKVPGCRTCGRTEWQLRKKFGSNIPKSLMGKCLLWRIQKRETELKNQRTCFEDCLIGRNKPYPHRWGSPGCKHREEFLIESSLKGTTGDEMNSDDPCPF